MRLLLLSFYFRPDLSAGSFRATALADALTGMAAPGSCIDVLTTLPNRYRSFSADAPRVETADGYTVHRIALPSHQSGMMDQSRAFLTYARAVGALTRGKRYDVVFATSSRLMTAALGARVAGRTGAKLYLDIRDIFADTIGDVLPAPAATLAGPAFSVLESRTIRRADAVNLVSPGFLEYFTTRYPGRRFSTISNGVDDAFRLAGPSADGRPQARTGPVTILYAGNVGEGQGLHAIVPGLATALGDQARLVVIGDGGRLPALQAAVAGAGCRNVQILPPMSRPELIELYRRADVLFVHLNDYQAFRKVLPSKLFEYAAMGKPLLAGVAGYAARFVQDEIGNAAVFPPCDVEAAVRAFRSLELVDRPRTDFIERYDRARLTSALARDVLALADPA